MAISLPRFQYLAPLVDANGMPTSSFHIWWDTFASNLESTLTGQANAIQELQDLNSDNVLTPGKKPIWILFYNFLSSEQADIDSKATSYSITTEKTNYDNAISALTTYLATLTTPVLWNDLSGNTTVVGTTFRGNFETVLTTKQALLNAINAAAKTLADSAQTAANTAQSTANTAKKNDKISASGTVPSQLLSAIDAGTNASITIAAHTRIYGDNTTVTIGSPQTITGLSYSTTYAIYYDDPTTSTTSPSYVATSTLSNAMANYVNGRHYVGQITTPAAGGGSTSGGLIPPGGGGPYP